MNTILLTGAGKMGSALLRGWLAHGIAPERLAVFEPQPSGDLLALGAEHKFRLNPAIDGIREVEALVLAVKPQSMQDALPAFSPCASEKTLVLSIAAGKPVGFLEPFFPVSPIVRAMPNTPAAIGQGITALYANARVTRTQRDLATLLMKAAGETVWIGDEALMDPVTAVSGSGPAYVFLLIEALALAGEKAGLDSALAGRLARQTVIGAAALAAQSPESAAQLRENVTSPGGTTAAALSVLMGSHGLEALMEEAVAAASRRSRELAE